jgi:CRP-like cAMP-binding protein
VLFQRGDPPEGLYIIVRGSVRAIIQDAQGADLTLAKIGMGELLGELSVLDGTPRSATALAITDGDALYVTAEEFRTWLADHTDAAWQLLGAMAERLRATDEQLAEIALLRIETRIARRLYQLFAEAGAGRLQSGSRTKLNQVELASTLGATRESINRQLGKLREAGVLERAGSELVLLDPAALEEAAEAL